MERLVTGEFPGWPSGDRRPVLELRISPEELTKTYGLDFSSQQDDLDDFVGSHFVDEEIGPVALIRYCASGLGTVLYVDAGVDGEAAVDRLISRLELTENDVVWSAS